MLKFTAVIGLLDKFKHFQTDKHDCNLQETCSPLPIAQLSNFPIFYLHSTITKLKQKPLEYVSRM